MISLTNLEFETILADQSKTIQGDLEWSEDEDHSPAVEFRADVETEAGYPLIVLGRYNPLAVTLSYTILHRGVGRIYALDMGKDHHNPGGERIGDMHKHKYREDLRDKEAYFPEDIVAPVNDPVAVWRQFCAEAGIVHLGKLANPPPVQEELF